jgi:excinuclease ABC subunit A
MEPEFIRVLGARENNLKNVSIDIPRNSFTVITGPSGCGKSSLAFDTLFAEGQRRYIESLSSYARQFLDQLPHPNVDAIEGLSPSISIEQKTVRGNPRSTVGTITEINNFLRLLFSKLGTPYCFECGKPIKKQSVDEITSQIMEIENGKKVFILAPIVRERKGEYRKELETLRKSGFVRVKIDGEVFDLGDHIKLDKNKKHTIEVFIDRLKIRDGIESRVTDSVENAIKLSEGLVRVEILGDSTNDSNVKNKSILFSEQNACPDCQISYPDLEPRVFSFNSPMGYCKNCEGLGYTDKFSTHLVIPNPQNSIKEGAIDPWADNDFLKQTLKSVSEHLGYSWDTPLKDYEKDDLEVILLGSEEKINLKYTGKYSEMSQKATFDGVMPYLERRWETSESDKELNNLASYRVDETCQTCDGARLRKESLSVKVENKNFNDVAQLDLESAHKFFTDLKFKGPKALVSDKILKEVRERLKLLVDIGLGYLSLGRPAGTLSGGESQRIRLASQIGSALTGVLYILDEPSIGLHARDNDKLIKTLKGLKERENTVIVIEHDDSTIKAADHIVDMGPGAGRLGGTIVSMGTAEELSSDEKSITGKYLSGELKTTVPDIRKVPKADYSIELKGCSKHNLKNIDVNIPLGLMNCITGVSGSGKSTLILDLLFEGIHDEFTEAKGIDGLKSIKGVDHIDKVIHIDQTPIGRTPRSNPTTYTGAFSLIRNLFAGLAEAKIRNYKAGRFSFNVKGGRCEYCEGDGKKKIEMHFLPDVFVECESCRGSRYNPETLEIKYKGKNIADVLDMTVSEATEFFRSVPRLHKILETLQDVGLDYITLGQSATTLSGGEAQRLKLSRELAKRDTGKTIYLLDEPSTGLHHDDVNKLLKVLHLLVERGNTILIIEHNMEIIRSSDWVIDLGPEGGDKGGELVAEGTPETIAKAKKSYTGKFI